MSHKQVLITGVAGFIGSSLAFELLRQGYGVTGVDTFDFSHTSGMEPTPLYQLKTARLARVIGHRNFTYIQHDLAKGMPFCETPDIIIHLAGQAGVRSSRGSSIEYIQDNILAFTHVMEYGRTHSQVNQVLYASSASVYGDRGWPVFPCNESFELPLPKSLYATTKRTMEMMAHNMSPENGYPRSTGLRFFSVYGPYGRPDMAPWRITEAMSGGPFVEIFNQGKWARDFTYIDDVVHAVSSLIGKHDLQPILNVGSGEISSGIELIEYIKVAIGDKHTYIGHIEKTNHKNPHDVAYTFADNYLLQEHIGKHQFTNLATGIRKFVSWYKDYKGNADGQY